MSRLRKHQKAAKIAHVLKRDQQLKD